MRYQSPKPPHCPSCAQIMRLARITSRFGDLPDLYTFECRACGVSHVEAGCSVAELEPENQATRVRRTGSRNITAAGQSKAPTQRRSFAAPIASRACRTVRGIAAWRISQRAQRDPGWK